MGNRAPGLDGSNPGHCELLHALGDPHEAEHRMMECLGQVLWEAQQAGGMPDEAAYLTCIQGLCPK